MFVSRTRPTVRKRCDSKYLFAWFAMIFFFFFGYRKSWPEVPILFQNLHLELVYTFKWTKSVAWLWRNQICEWTQSILKKIKKSPYLLTHGRNGGSVRETNIFLRVALFVNGKKWGCPIQTVICYIEVPFKAGLTVNQITKINFLLFMNISKTRFTCVVYL